MKIEWVIFFLMAVCLCMIGFNLVFALWERLREKTGRLRAGYLCTQLATAIERCGTAGMGTHLRRLSKLLTRLSWLEAYDRALEQRRAQGQQQLEGYLAAASPLYLMLLPAYKGKDDLHRAFYCNMVEKWYLCRPADPVLVSALLAFAQRGSFYPRQNALEALSAVGGPADLATAFAAADRTQEFHHPKLLTEIALSFPGDADCLAAELAERFAGMSPSAQVAAVNFMRMSGAVASPGSCRGEGGACRAGSREAQEAWLMGLLADSSQDRELRLACMRWLGAFPSENSFALVLGFARDAGEGAWEFAAVACSVLASYPSPATVEVLKGCLSSRVWHVRNNAAASLYALGASLEDDLADVLEGDDSYARDMLLARWERERCQRGGE